MKSYFTIRLELDLDTNGNPIGNTLGYNDGIVILVNTKTINRVIEVIKKKKP